MASSTEWTVCCVRHRHRESPFASTQSLSRGEGWRILRQWVAVDVEDKGHERVIANHPDQVDRALLSPPSNDGVKCVVGHVALDEGLRRELIHCRTVRVERTTSSCSNGTGVGRVKTSFDCELSVSSKLELCRPPTCDDQNRQLVQHRRYGRTKPYVESQLLCWVGETGTMEQCLERSTQAAGPAPRARHDCLLE